MDANDPRHGEDRGYTAHKRDGEPACEPCTRAHCIANKRLKMTTRRPAKVPVLGSQRRIQALQALGHGRATIAKRLGYSDVGSLTYIMRPTTKTILAVTAARIEQVYDELSMVRPLGPGATRARTWAAKSGFVPPLAWDDIDDPDETPATAYVPRARFAQSCDPYDEAAVLRILNGDWRLPCTAADKAEVIARWTLLDPLASRHGRTDDYWDKPSYAYLERLTGWKVERYTPRADGAA